MSSAVPDLPSPEEYGRTLAARRRKSSQVPVILSQLQSLMDELKQQEVNIQVVRISEISGLLENVISVIQAQNRDYEEQLAQLDIRTQQLLEKAQEQLDQGLTQQQKMDYNWDAMTMAVQSRPTVDIPEVPIDDLRQHISEQIYRLRQDIEPAPAEAPEPPAYRLEVTSRDQEGNIKTVKASPS